MHEEVINSGCKITGCTAHFVDNEYDHGPIISQRAISVRDNETPESLKARVFSIECDVLRSVLNLYAKNKLIVKDKKVFVA